MSTGKDKDFGTIATGQPEKANVKPDPKCSIDVLGHPPTQGVVNQTFYVDVPHRGPIDYTYEHMIPQDDRNGSGDWWNKKQKEKSNNG